MASPPRGGTFMRWSRFAPTTLMVLSLMGSSTPAVAYDLMTHANVSAQSFDASRALRSSLEDLGINATDVFDPDRDLHDPELSASESTAFTLFHVNQGTVRDWLVAGAIREDDYRRHRVLESLFGCPPPPNPQSAQEQIDRPFNHFFDVQRGGTGLAIVGGPPAPDGALGREGRGPSPSQNHFSLPDARVYQIRSLREESRAERDRNTARLFRTLGQVLHVLQDMAQPQHTRNDPHLGCTRTVAEWFAGEKSWY